MANNIEKTNMFNNSHESVLLTTEHGMWIDMEVKPPTQPIQIVQSMEYIDQVFSNPIYYHQTPVSQPNGFEAKTFDPEHQQKNPKLSTLKTAKQATVIHTPDKLDSAGQKVFQELFQECEAARERSSNRSEAVDKAYKNSLDRFLNAEKWTVKKIDGKTGLYAPVAVKIEPFIGWGYLISWLLLNEQDLSWQRQVTHTNTTSHQWSNQNNLLSSTFKFIAVKFPSLCKCVLLLQNTLSSSYTGVWIHTDFNDVSTQYRFQEQLVKNLFLSV